MDELLREYEKIGRKISVLREEIPKAKTAVGLHKRLKARNFYASKREEMHWLQRAEQTDAEEKDKNDTTPKRIL